MHCAHSAGKSRPFNPSELSLRFIRATPAMLALALVGCAGGTDSLVQPTDVGGPLNVSVNPGAVASDTVHTILRDPITVDVKGVGGSARSGVEVRFTPLNADTTANYRPSVLLAGSTSLTDTSVSRYTDARGRATVQVQLAQFAGPAAVEVVVPAAGFTDTVRFVARPGNAVRFTVTPTDSAVYVGKTYALRVAAFDRYGNARDTTPTLATYTGIGSGIDVSPSGIVSGLALGRTQFLARIGTREDTMRVSVMPVGTIAVSAGRAIGGDSIGISVVNLDASGYRRIAFETPSRQYGAENPPGHEMWPRWDPQGQRIAYWENGDAAVGGPLGHPSRLMLLGANGAAQPVLPDTVVGASQPSFSPDGQWLYFTMQPGFQRVYRMHPDGTGLAEVFDTTVEPLPMGTPTVSPDGQWLAYTVGSAVGSRLRVRSLTTGALTPLDVDGTTPRWSPSGDVLAYVQTYLFSGYFGLLWVVRPDGTGARQLVSNQSYSAGLDWSRDGKFVIATASTPLIEVIDVASGARTPLPNSYNLSQPSSRP
jgi:hypothetical protein